LDSSAGCTAVCTAAQLASQVAAQLAVQLAAQLTIQLVTHLPACWMPTFANFKGAAQNTCNLSTISNDYKCRQIIKSRREIWRIDISQNMVRKFGVISNFSWRFLLAFLCFSGRSRKMLKNGALIAKSTSTQPVS
jgi:hypothetical protein